MSGIAYAASTIPGSVATFWSCSSERSATIASSSGPLANTRAGTRMSGLASAGISNSVSSTRRSSNVQDDMRSGPASLSDELQAMVRDRLDDRTRGSAPAAHDRSELAGLEAQLLRRVRNELFGIREEHELLEPRDQEIRDRRRSERDGDVEPIALARVAVADELGERGQSLAEDVLVPRRLDQQPKLGRVLEPAVHINGRHRRCSRARGRHAARRAGRPATTHGPRRSPR